MRLWLVLFSCLNFLTEILVTRLVHSIDINYQGTFAASTILLCEHCDFSMFRSLLLPGSPGLHTYFCEQYTF
ncbi:hypothetical protein GOP47_0010767 [Adiantum capillus-veneris]|uniref:Secreted protein n=1 Tax=Adiantum capillus-veneris TaxID=13818 RepID=A0A9D4UVR0_ADICA|nr:hypothetical protein GOP47_0010767 [Adiantum capillus-veneris]